LSASWIRGARFTERSFGTRVSGSVFGARTRLWGAGARDFSEAGHRDGAASGIGRAIAELLLADGYRVGVMDIDGDGTRNVENGGDKRRCRLEFCDLCDPRATETAVLQLLAWLRGFDSLVCNARVNAYFDAPRMIVAEWDELFDLDLKAAWLCMKHSLPELVLSNGIMIVVSSIHARVTNRGCFRTRRRRRGSKEWCAASQSIGAKWCVSNAVAPAATLTPLVKEVLARQPDPEAARRTLVSRLPLKRMVEPSEVAQLVQFLPSDPVSGITNTQRGGCQLWTCSCASGAAFEGTHIRDGIRAAQGIKERVSYLDGRFQVQTIGDGAPGFAARGSSTPSSPP